jgi:hypothetical protein
VPSTSLELTVNYLRSERMDSDTSFCEICVCGRSFHSPGALKGHKRSCSKSKKRLSGALQKAKDNWVSRKRIRIEASGSLPVQGQMGTHARDSETHSGVSSVHNDPEVCSVHFYYELLLNEVTI